MPDPPSSDRPARPEVPATRAGVRAFEREQVVARLSDLFAQDVLQLEEFERRVTVAYRAATRAELDALTADLPAISRVGDEVAAGSTLPATAVPVRRVAAFFANVERGGFIDVPAHLEIRVFAGNVELDLSEARFAPGWSEISVRAILGNVEITLPSNVLVENDGSGFLGSFESHAGGAVPGGQVARPMVRITGRAILGNVETTVAEASGRTGE